MFLVPSEARWVRLRNSRTQAATPSIPRRYMDLRWKVVGEFKPFGVHVPHDPVRVIRLWPQPLFSSLKVRLSVTRRSPFADAGVLGLSLADPHPRRLPTRGSFGTWWAFFPISLKGCGPVKAGRTTQQFYRQGESNSGELGRGRCSGSVPGFHRTTAVLSPRPVSNIPRRNWESRQGQPKVSTAKKDPSHKPRADWNLCWKALTPEEKRVEVCLLIALETEDFLRQQPQQQQEEQCP